MVIKKNIIYDIRTIISINNIMDDNKILKAYLETKNAQTKYIICHKSLKNKYLLQIKINNDKFENKTKNTVSDIKILLAYLKKHNELKLVYNSYKDIMKQFLQFKKKFAYLGHISKPILSAEELKHMVKQQNNIMSHVDYLSKKIPKIPINK
jgi:hypothetical protein